MLSVLSVILFLSCATKIAKADDDSTKAPTQESSVKSTQDNENVSVQKADMTDNAKIESDSTNLKNDTGERPQFEVEDKKEIQSNRVQNPKTNDNVSKIKDEDLKKSTKEKEQTIIPSKAEYNKNIQGVMPIDLSAYLKKYDKGDKFLTYIGFEDCKHCRKFSPVIKTFLSNPNPPLYYLDYGLKGSFSTATPQEINAFFESFNEPFQFMGTPTIALIADHQVKSMVAGDDSTLEDLNQLVDDGGFKIESSPVAYKRQQIIRSMPKNGSTNLVKNETTMPRSPVLFSKVKYNEEHLDQFNETRTVNNIINRKLPQTNGKSEENTKFTLFGITMLGALLIMIGQILHIKYKLFERVN